MSTVIFQDKTSCLLLWLECLILVLQKVKEVGVLISYRIECVFSHPARCCCQPLLVLFTQQWFPPPPCTWPVQQVLPGAQGINLKPGNPWRSQDQLGGKRTLSSSSSTCDLTTPCQPVSGEYHIQSFHEHLQTVTPPPPRAVHSDV